MYSSLDVPGALTSMIDLLFLLKCKELKEWRVRNSISTRSFLPILILIYLCSWLSRGSSGICLPRSCTSAIYTCQVPCPELEQCVQREARFLQSGRISPFPISVVKGSLEVKLPIWRDEKQRWEESETREDYKRERERKRVTRKKMQVREMSRKSRNNVFFQRGRKVGSSKRRVWSHVARW